VRAKELGSKFVGVFPEAKIEYATEKRLKITIPSTRASEAGTFVRDVLGFDHISAVSGVDWIAKGEFEVIYFVGSFRPGLEDFVFCLSERIPRDNPVVSTLIQVWPGAEYHERETHEMFGINFQGHPSNAHLLLPEDWNDLPPLRKDYVSPGR
jgi:NADH-quinone oxidoreductase subunit C